ncbi:hypothetical protein ABII15_04985 [Streptomyces sp. HUAS MG91]|uniref:Uncharacterized protein n=1 Tax=Streptomyces tabacisoli TaxID=3156398 RepID=A0AAU8IND4_9ACTN
MFDRARKAWSTWRKRTVRRDERRRDEIRSTPGPRPAAGGPRRTPNLFEAAAAYVAACAEDDQERLDEAASWVDPNALAFGVNELACRALIALARERDESPRVVARSLLGLPVG